MYLYQDSSQFLPLAKELHSIWVTLMEKLREKETPLDTTVKVIGLLVDNPISTYTAKRGRETM